MNAHRTDEPTDRLTRMCDAMTDALEAHPEFRGDERCIVFLLDGEEGGIEWFGYEDHGEVVADLLAHLKALLEVNGQTLQFVPMPGRG